MTNFDEICSDVSKKINPVIIPATRLIHTSSNTAEERIIYKLHFFAPSYKQGQQPQQLMLSTDVLKLPYFKGTSIIFGCLLQSNK
jgi:hypothetical protein